MQRREFLRNSCMACAGSALGLSAFSLAGCASLPLVKATHENGGLSFPRSAFAEATQVIVRHPELSYDLLVVKSADGTHRALYMRCTHEDQPLSATAKGLHCTSHGSRFALDGTVMTGPATEPLLSFPVTSAGEFLTIRTNTP
ncbi:MAG: Rieske (2Fe-2S) protein [Flavobacteriales bacterium]|nr:Rieske (2Fe-2S) protein [Flavobacteriales bacterium]